MTWGQLGHHRKPIVFANVKGFWDPMLALLDHMSSEGFIHTAQRVKPLVVDDPEAIVAAIMAQRYDPAACPRPSQISDGSMDFR